MSKQHIIAWHPTRNVQVHEFVDAAKLHNIAVPEDIIVRQRTAAHRAIRTAYAVFASASSDRLLLADLPADEQFNIKVQVTRETVLEDSAEYYEFGICGFTEKKAHLCHFPAGYESFAETLRYTLDEAYLNCLSSLQPADTSALLKKVFEAYQVELIPVKTGSGVYYVHNLDEQTVEHLSKFTSAINVGLTTIQVVADGKVASLVKDYVEGLLTKWKNMVTLMKKDSTRGLSARIGELQDLARIITAHSDVLGSYAEELARSVVEGRNLLLEHFKNTLED